MHDQNNIFYAIALSLVVLITWQYFFATSFLGKPSAPEYTSKNTSMTSQIGAPASGTAMTGPQAPAVVTPVAATPGTQALQPVSRQQALARSQRVAINTPRLRGSIALSGGRIDDLSLVQYRETIDPRSAAIELRRLFHQNWPTGALSQRNERGVHRRRPAASEPTLVLEVPAGRRPGFRQNVRWSVGWRLRACGPTSQGCMTFGYTRRIGRLAPGAQVAGKLLMWCSLPTLSGCG